MKSRDSRKQSHVEEDYRDSAPNRTIASPHAALRLAYRRHDLNIAPARRITSRFTASRAAEAGALRGFMSNDVGPPCPHPHSRPRSSARGDSCLRPCSCCFKRVSARPRRVRVPHPRRARRPRPAKRPRPTIHPGAMTRLPPTSPP